MRTSFTLILTLIISFTLSYLEKATAQNYCGISRFDTTDVIPRSALRDTTLVYGHNYDWQGKYDTLHVRLFYPDNNKDTFTARPLIVIVHGGGFVDGDIQSTKKKEIYFAKKGFVVASVEYRLGWRQDCVPGIDTSLAYAIYRADQDINAAIRFLVDKATTYKIDTKRILLHGESAGALACLIDAFVNQQEFNAKYPGITAKLGDLNNATNTLTNTFAVRGVFSKSGALFDTSFIDASEIIPVLLVHGTNDHVVPFISGNAYACTSYPYLYGSYSIQQRLQNLGDCYELDYQPGGGHGTVYNTEDTFLFKRESHFFKRLLCKDCQQIIYKDETLVQDKTLSDNIVAQQLQQQEKIQSAKFNVTVFPNPSSNEFKLNIQSRDSALIEIEVTDVTEEHSTVK